MLFKLWCQSNSLIKQDLSGIVKNPQSFRGSFSTLRNEGIGGHFSIVLTLKHPFLMQKKKNGLLLPFLFVSATADKSISFLKLLGFGTGLCYVGERMHGGNEMFQYN